MEDAFKMLAGGGISGIATAIALALVALAAWIPKLLNGIKGDNLTGNVLDRVKDLEAKSDKQDAKIHKFAVKVTKLVVVVIRLEALLKDNNIPIPLDLMTEVQKLRLDPEEDDS
jgi:hypothetical protein